MKHIRFPKGNALYINTLNKCQVLNLIRENQHISRADVAKMSGLSAPTVTRIVDSLIHEEGLISEIGAGKSSGGRKPTLLEFAGQENYVIGIDLGTSNIYGVLTNLNADIIAEVKRPTRVNEGFNKVVARTADIIKILSSHTRIKGKHIYGVGLAVAGLVNQQSKLIEFSPDFHWHKKDLLKALGKKCNLYMTFDNVTRVMALGELWYGVGKEIKNFICVNIGYGIGAGIIINGQPLYGEIGFAGEFGHVTMERSSPLKCECGNYGCLEALSSGHAIALQAQTGLPKRESILNDMCDGDISSITAEMVADAAKAGDPYASEIFERAAEYIGIGIAGLINLFSPAAVIIGGGVSHAGDILFNQIREVVALRSLDRISHKVIIQPTAFGPKAAAMGAIALVLNEVLSLNLSQRTKATQE
jgi:glucokinase-like ROK family protein